MGWQAVSSAFHVIIDAAPGDGERRATHARGGGGWIAGSLVVVRGFGSWKGAQVLAGARAHNASVTR